MPRNIDKQVGILLIAWRRTHYFFLRAHIYNSFHSISLHACVRYTPQSISAPINFFDSARNKNVHPNIWNTENLKKCDTPRNPFKDARPHTQWKYIQLRIEQELYCLLNVTFIRKKRDTRRVIASSLLLSICLLKNSDKHEFKRV